LTRTGSSVATSVCSQADTNIQTVAFQPYIPNAALFLRTVNANGQILQTSYTYNDNDQLLSESNSVTVVQIPVGYQTIASTGNPVLSQNSSVPTARLDGENCGKEVRLGTHHMS